MGAYLNPGSGAFRKAISAPVYVDKTAMIAYLNSLACTNKGYLSVSRPRRFGKTMAVDMICAYYGRGTDARELFEQRTIAQAEPIRRAFGETLAWDAYLGAFDVVRITMTEFLEGARSIADMVDQLTAKIVSELAQAYPNAIKDRHMRLLDAMRGVYAHTGTPFVIVIDEWDAPIRERKEDEDGQRLYLEFLRDWLKDKDYVALAYITGILPIKKYGVHSALNMFDEYSMAAPMQLAEYAGFTEDEVRSLCAEWGRDFESMRAWYDGYKVIGAVPPRQFEPPRYSLYAPLSVAAAVSAGLIRNYWSGTETYEALAEYIRMDFDGLKAAVALLMDGGRKSVNLNRYQNDMTTFKDADDVLALLVHLGYLGWDDVAGEVFIPNREVLGVFRDSTEDPEWDGPLREYEASKALVQST